MTEVALEFDRVSYSYGQNLYAVDEVSFQVMRGEFLCLLGPSGCGKTTCLRVAAGLNDLAEGEVRLSGEVVSSPTVRVPPEARSVGLMFQDFALFPHMTVADNVGFGQRGRGEIGEGLKVPELLERLDLSSYSKSLPHELSGGQQQRVALARALAAGPDVLLLDEPFSGLDPSLRSRVRDDTLHLIKETGTTALMVTHDPDEALFMADRLALMRAGKVAQIGVPNDLFFTPKDAFVAQFFGETNLIDGFVDQGWVVTELGRLRQTSLPEKSKLEVLVRPEAIHLCPIEGPGMPVVEVEASRQLGRQSMIHMALATASGNLHLHCKMDGQFLPAPGERFGVGVNPDLVYVFNK